MNVRNMRYGGDILDVVNAVCLTTGNVWRHEPNGRELEIFALDGDIWVTEAGNANDYILRAGDALLLPGTGVIVVESLTPFACIRSFEGEGRISGAGAGAPVPDVPPVGIEA